MRRCAFALMAMTLTGPVMAVAQTVQPVKVPAGGEVTVTQDCKADKPPVLVLAKDKDRKEITAGPKSASPKWIFTVAAGTPVQKYTATFRCPLPQAVESPAGELEVAAAETPPPPTGTPGEPTVAGVTNLTRAEKTAKSGTSQQGTPAPTEGEPAELKDVLEIEVTGLDDWLKDPKNSLASLRLFLAGIELKNVVPVRSLKSPARLRVGLEPESDTTKDDRDGIVRKAWVQVLRTAYRRPVDISVGPTGQAPFGTKTKLAIQVFPSYTWAVVAFLVAVAIAILILGKTTNLLRDGNGQANPPYSLAKHQMALWFLVVIGAYIYIWLITGFFMSISTTALTLIGISGATGLIAVTMDASKRSEEVKTLIALRAEHDALEKALNDPATGLQTQLRATLPGSATATELTATIAPRLTRLQELKTLLSLASPVRAVNRVWYQDLLSDENGISFHRLQMALWTLVLVVVFIRAVYSDILMPDFDATLLGLIGISSGTYLGFKFPEKPA
jgi:hypothetical protein